MRDRRAMTFDEILTHDRQRKYVGPYCSIYVAGAGGDGKGGNYRQHFYNDDWTLDPLVAGKRNSSASQIVQRPSSGHPWAYGSSMVSHHSGSGEFWLSANAAALRKVKSAEILCNPRIVVDR